MMKFNYSRSIQRKREQVSEIKVRKRKRERVSVCVFNNMQIVGICEVNPFWINLKLFIDAVERFTS